MKSSHYFSILLVLFIGLCLLSLSWGRYPITLSDVVQTLLGKPQTDIHCNIIFNLRLPRILAAVLIGAALSIAGTTYQGIFRNPLVSPDILGVSNGACVGAAVAILIGVDTLSVQVFAFIGGLFAVLIAMNLPRLIQCDSNIMLVLSGIIVSGFMMATLGLIKYLADPETQLADIVYWQLGSLTKSNYANLAPLSPIILFSILTLFAMRWRINVLSLGEREAKLIGANIRFERGVMVCTATLLTVRRMFKRCYRLAGISYPPARLFIGDNNVKSLPIAALIGAIFLLIVDTLARNLYVQEIPLSILTGFIGAPFFAWVLIKQNVTH
ncbi:FecCD family ABC transporter permease [Rodentibacter myodis]|uniref:FecCD family ABC transporter permease n=1 Tax=Rodentibacter myodis TaxID=1907939 RepID=UPI000986565C|nr:iron ABC transporter permease [Rodentibacter myodis]